MDFEAEVVTADLDVSVDLTTSPVKSPLKSSPGFQGAGLTQSEVEALKPAEYNELLIETLHKQDYAAELAYEQALLEADVDGGVAAAKAYQVAKDIARGTANFLGEILVFPKRGRVSGGATQKKAKKQKVCADTLVPRSTERSKAMLLNRAERNVQYAPFTHDQL